jgi:imidazoleglycerol-phosphate dehydratase
MREGNCERKTLETSVKVRLSIPTLGCSDETLPESKITTTCGFLDHMLTLLAVHGGFSLEVLASGDTHVDYHHLVEDVGLTLGDCLDSALGDRKGIQRYGNSFIPMDESLAQATVDISGRPFFLMNGSIPAQKVGDFDTELMVEFLRSLAMRARITLHVNLHYAQNAHHACEAIIKSVAHALQEAASLSTWTTGVPSSKGVL